MKRWVKILILAYLSLLFFGSFLAVGAMWIGVFEETYPKLSEIERFLYYFFAGSIGGSLRHLYMFCSHYMNDEFIDPRHWIMYIFFPLFATGTAVIAVNLIQSGILMIDFADNIDGPYAQVSVAFFVGFGFNRFLNKLNEISTGMFDMKKQEKKQD
ncbi:hypothetical protein E1I69_22320 [Bacillus timonensis]|uniref:Uncharacterized protein n=1 Tax=Bacillus timonensis TaxID=1033734 RepID=A0A4S3PJ61_9BACI|nr:hypothetical protein [Bacillus timonensis]THE09450.1 hypothetical protein E1I69_22320 [Bacillus timonensis]